MANKIQSQLRLFPNDPLPEGYPKPTLSGAEQVEVCGVDDFRAAIIVRKAPGGQMTSHIRGLWFNTQDSGFAQKLLAVIREEHSIPGTEIILNVNGSHGAFLSELKKRDFPCTARMMSKPVPSGEAIHLPDAITYRHMAKSELKEFLDHVEHDLARQDMANKGGAKVWELAKERARDMMNDLLPNRGSTDGHTFVVIQQGCEAPVRVGCLWVYMDKAKQRSFCYDLEIEECVRGKGLGRKGVTVWEFLAKEQAAVTLALNVFSTNTAALKLYEGTGFAMESAIFILGGGNTNSI